MRFLPLASDRWHGTCYVPIVSELCRWLYFNCDYLLGSEMKYTFVSALFLIAVVGCDAMKTTEVERPADVNTASVERDNSAVNERDRASNAKTPLDQNENQKDIDITANVRSRVVDTKMSTNAQNVKIITQDGRVTLRGPVATEAEKSQIEEFATAVAGAGNVDNQLEVQP
jgi:hyperosmotically inducible protein